MTTFQIELPDDIVKNLNTLESEGDRNDFIVEAIRCYLHNLKKKQALSAALKEGYQANYQEALAMAKDFEATYSDGLDD